ncbi:putative ABC transporter ATP-binding protein YxlF [Pseudoclavibacter triregionum]|nr:putative ABC transporter ATP-binding protein YxlF [Pseudoclavibacter triregionum]
MIPPADDHDEAERARRGAASDDARSRLMEPITVDEHGASEVPAEPASRPAPQPAVRNPILGAQTAEGLATMTPVTTMTGASDRRVGEVVVAIRGLTKRFGQVEAVREVDLDVREGSITGIVGPNGAGKTTTLSMATGLLRPTEGTVEVLGVDVWANPKEAHRSIGVLPDRLRTFEQLTGAQLLYYTGVLRGLDREEATSRAASLIRVFGLETAADRLVADCSAGMAKKISLASALIHSPRVLVLDEPFEAIDPVSASELSRILLDFVGRGGAVILSSHSMDLVQRICDHVAVIVAGEILAQGTVDEVRGDVTLEERFRDLAQGPRQEEGLDWLDLSFS